MKKNRKKILFGLTVLTLISILGKPAFSKIISVNSNNKCAYEAEPDNYDGVQVLGFTCESNFTIF